MYGLDFNTFMWDIPRVITTKADDRKRVVIPDAKPGQVFDVQSNGDGSITLTPLKPRKRKGSILDGLKPLTKEQCEQCWGPGSEDEEWDKFVAHCASLPAGPPPEDE